MPNMINSQSRLKTDVHAAYRWSDVAAVILAASIFSTPVGAEERFSFTTPDGFNGEQIDFWTQNFATTSAAPLVMPVELGSPKVSISTDLGIKTRRYEQAIEAPAQEGLKDVTYSMSFKVSALSDEQVKSFIDAIGEANVVLTTGLTDDVQLAGVAGMLPASGNQHIGEFTATWLDAVDAGMAFAAIDVDYMTDTTKAEYLSMADGVGFYPYVHGNLSADTDWLNVTQQIAMFSEYKISGDSGDQTPYAAMQFFGLSEADDAWYNKEETVTNLMFDGTGIMDMGVDYADMTKRRIDGGGTTGEAMFNF